jgi:hypothetical protein
MWEAVTLPPGEPRYRLSLALIAISRSRVVTVWRSQRSKDVTTVGVGESGDPVDPGRLDGAFERQFAELYALAKRPVMRVLSN